MASVAAGMTAKRPPLWTIGGASLIGAVRGRCFYASLSQTGLPAGTVLGGMPKDQLLARGWRVPFLVSIVIAVAGVLIRDHWQQMVLVGGSFLGFGLFATKNGPGGWRFLVRLRRPLGTSCCTR